jgi:hypothetical protein
MSVAAAAPTTLAEKLAGSRRAFMAAIITPPTAAALAGPEPEMPPRNMATAIATSGSMPGPRPTMATAKFTRRSGHARAVKDRAHQHEHRNGQQRVFAQAGVEVLRHGQQAEPLAVGIGQRNGGSAGQAQRGANRHAQEHQAQKGGKQQRGDHGCCSPWPAGLAGCGELHVRRHLAAAPEQADGAPGDEQPRTPAARSNTTTAARRCRARFRQSGSRPRPRAR